MRKSIILITALLLISAHLSAQTPVYLTKTYKPLESDRYTAYPSLEIEGGDTWNNCFVLGVINNYHGSASFSLGSKYETISFIIGPGKSHGKHDPNVVQLIGGWESETNFNIRGQYETLRIVVGPLATDNGNESKSNV